MNIKILSIPLFAGFLSVALLPTGNADDNANQLFREGNTLLEAGKYDQSLEVFNELVRKGFSGKTLYYNLGNNHYRRGERGKAILWYERAKRIAPRDADVQFNLKLARSHVKNINVGFIEKIVFFFSSSELASGGAVLAWIFFVLLGLSVLGKLRGELWPSVALWSSGLLFLFIGAWFGVNVSWGNKPWAIIVTPPGEVRNGPGNDYVVGFTIPEGSKTLILNRRPKWTEIGVPQEGLKGWIPTDEIEEIRIKTEDLFRLG